MKIYKEWLCDDDNKIVYKPLSFWAEYFGLKPMDGDEYKCYWRHYHRERQ